MIWRATGLNVSLHVPVAFATAELASGGAVQVAADKRSLLVPEFVIADAIILRPDATIASDAFKTDDAERAPLVRRPKRGFVADARNGTCADPRLLSNTGWCE